MMVCSVQILFRGASIVRCHKIYTRKQKSSEVLIFLSNSCIIELQNFGGVYYGIISKTVGNFEEKEYP